MSEFGFQSSGSGGGGGGSTAVVVLGGGTASSVRCGAGNTASGGYSTALGKDNAATAIYSTISGGYGNLSCAEGSYVGGGYANAVENCYSVVVGGWINTNSGYKAFIGGGFTNTASGGYGVVAGGNQNTNSSFYSGVISGGGFNTSSGNYASILGGFQNTASGCYSGILGGNCNTVSHARSFIVGSNITTNRACTTFVNDLTVTSMSSCSGQMVCVGANGLLTSISSAPGIHIQTKPRTGFAYTNILTSGSSTFGNSGGILYLTPFIPVNTLTITSAAIQVTTLGAATNMKILVYSDSSGLPTSLLLESSLLDISTVGYKTYTTSFTFNAGTTYWIGTVASGAAGAVTSTAQTLQIAIAPNSNTTYNAFSLSGVNLAAIPTTLSLTSSNLGAISSYPRVTFISA